jgi:hypothetical protein
MQARKYILRDDESMPEDGQSHMSLCTKYFKDALLSLKLTKAGIVCLGPIITYSDTFLIGGTTSHGSSRYTKPHGERLSITGVDNDKIKEFYSKLSSVDYIQLDRPLSLALRRFDMAVERDSSEDSLLDILIALEAIILHESGNPEDRGELSFRLSVRLAYLVGASPDDRMKIFETTRKAYRLRSKIVHGGGLSDDTDLPTIATVEDYCRQSLRKMIVDGLIPFEIWNKWLFS